MPIINMVYKKKKWWKPWANTYIYYPLKSNGNDYSWNNRNLTTSNLTFSNEVAVLWDNVLAYYNIGNFPNWTQAFTMSFWIRLSSLASSYNLIWFIKNYNTITQNYSDWDKTIQIWNDGTITFDIYDGSVKRVSTSSWYISTNTWYNIIGIYDGSKMSMYINNTKIWEVSASWTYSTDYLVLNGYNSRNTSSARWTQWDLSDFILENKARTAQEVADYYNLTKSNYWIS